MAMYLVGRKKTVFRLVRSEGLEPSTYGLKVRCSTNWAKNANGAQGETRTRTTFRPPAPEASVSTNSTTCAYGAQREIRTLNPFLALAPQASVYTIPPVAHMAERERFERSNAFLRHLLSREAPYQLEYRSVWMETGVTPFPSSKDQCFLPRCFVFSSIYASNKGFFIFLISSLPIRNYIGRDGGNRTRTVLPPSDFKSDLSTCSITSPYGGTWWSRTIYAEIFGLALYQLS